MDWLWIIVVIMAVLLVMQNKENKRYKKGKQSEPQVEEEKSTRTDYKNCYQPKYLLTKNEWYAYKKLQPLATSLGLVVLPKVRLLDILEPRKGEKDYKALFWKVQAKHVDFLICNQDLRIKGVVELDDSSHDRKDRKDRDSFVDEILQSVGYKVIHTRYIDETTLQAFAEPVEEETVKA